MNTNTAKNSSPRESTTWLARFGLAFVWVVVAVSFLWAIAALYIDVRLPAWKIPLMVIYAVVVVAILVKCKLRFPSALGCFACFCVVLIWWFSLKPTNQASWEPNVDRPAWIEVDKDQATIHNLRTCDYQTETAYRNCWSDRTVNLSDLRGVDLFFTTWGVRWIAHPILSFDFGKNQHVAFSIEARYRVGQAYSAILGFFRQYELIFVVADERDVIRLRTNYRKGEEVYLYRGRLAPEEARGMFQAYVQYLNRLKSQPEWYNAATRNCTTTLDRQLSAKVVEPEPWNYQFLLNGTLDKLLYDRNRLVTNGLSFDQLKQQAHINTAATAAGNSPDFSALIRAGRPGFEDWR
jgi:hypothetical protein